MLKKLLPALDFAHRNYKHLALFFVLVTGIFTYEKLKELNAPDFRVFYIAAKYALEDPTKIYSHSPDRFLYPPPAALFFTPFQVLPSWEWSKHVWYGVSLLIILWMARMHVAALLSTLILFRYFVINLRYGQVNILLLATMILCALALLRREKKDQLISGALLAFGGIIKLFPVLQIIDVLGRRRWLSLLSMTTSIVALAALPAFFWGWETTKELYLSYPSQLQSKGVPSYTHNQSFTALLFRLFSGESFHSFSVGMLNWTLFIIPKSSLQLFGTIIGALFSIGAWTCAFRRKLDLDFMSAASFSVLFMSHIVWKPYFIFLFIPLLQVLLHVLTKVPRRAAMLGIVSFVLIGPLSSSDIWGVSLSRTFDALSLHMFSALILFVLWCIYPKSDALSLPRNI